MVINFAGSVINGMSGMCLNCSHETKDLNVVLGKFNSCMSNGHTLLALTIARGRDLLQLS